jgi:hypothetical protein
MGMTKETRLRLREYYEAFRPKDTVDPRQIYVDVRRELGKRAWESSSEEGEDKKNQVILEKKKGACKKERRFHKQKAPKGSVQHEQWRSITGKERENQQRAVR